MHPLRVLLLISLAVAALVGYGFAVALERAHVDPREATILGAFVFFLFMIPWAGVSLWAVRRAGDLDRLTGKTRALVSGSRESVADRPYHGELDDLARAIEEARAILIRQQADFDEHRRAMDQIVAALGEGLLAVNAQRRVVFANDRARELLGIDVPTGGRSLLEITRRQPVIAAFDRALAGETSTERLVVGERQVEVRVFPVAASEIAAVALFIDITQLERLQRIRKEFLDDFSHEVRTPLAGLRGAVETFEQGGLTDQQDEQLRAVMTRQLARIERLAKDLSELNHIESGELVLDRRPVDLAEVVRDVSEDFRERVPVTVDLRGDSAVADADRARVEQIVANLVDNAWKHGGSGGTILVETREEGGDAIVRVSDQGEGIPPQELDRIFHRFYRVDRSRSQQVPGTGLGLAITKHLVLLHGGSIRAWNREGGGATFEVRLPAARIK